MKRPTVRQLVKAAWTACMVAAFVVCLTDIWLGFRAWMLAPAMDRLNAICETVDEIHRYVTPDGHFHGSQNPPLECEP